MSAKSMVRKSQSTELATMESFETELREYAQKAVASEQSVSAGAFLSIRGGILAFKGQPVEGNKVNVVILDHVLENQFYDQPFDPDTPAIPACYAFGRDVSEMSPHEKAPNPQADACQGCEMNEWGSAAQLKWVRKASQKGKACKNVRRLALLDAEALVSPDAITAAEIAYLKLPVMSVREFSQYANALNNRLGRPPFAVITQLSVVPDTKAQYLVKFSLIDQITDPAIYQALKAKHAEASEAITFPYSLPSESEEEQPARPVQKTKGGFPSKSVAKRVEAQRKGAKY